MTAQVSVTLNGDPVLLAQGTTVAAVVEQLAPGGRGVAVAIDREVVPRSAWADVVVVDGAVVEVVTAAAGG